MIPAVDTHARPHGPRPDKRRERSDVCREGHGPAMGTVRFLGRLTVVLGAVLLGGVTPGALVGQDLASTAPSSVARRIAARDFPSIFQAWNPADNLKGEDPLTTLARHDLVWHAPSFFDLTWNRNPEGLAEGFTPESIARAKTKRAQLLERNPQLVLLAEIRYRDAHRSFLPDGHEWWRRDDQGKLVMGWEEGGYIQLDLRNPSFRRHVAAQCRAVVETGAVDGVMLDWWRDDEDRLALIRAVRAAVGSKALIITNPNDEQTPRTAPYINGYFMECYRTAAAEDWQRIDATLTWAERHLRAPRVNCVEFWYHRSRDDLDLMRAVTTLVLTHSDGYALFSDPNELPTPDHLHNWYPFWDTPLGKPAGEGVPHADGTTHRDFERGTAVYNPLGNRRVTLRFNLPRTSAATGATARTHILNEGDGDLYLRDETRPKAQPRSRLQGESGQANTGRKR
jgi:hypothetical protein